MTDKSVHPEGECEKELGEIEVIKPDGTKEIILTIVCRWCGKQMK
jgi:hypothetical protein